ncbi:phosphoenolpyruvate--protein phosphotransferase [Thiospirillum jenense]|uniref:phosphoenolpyruvate--protein phosphotransferase n=1 Tax=Thiospirillum jenense TaxID=1653858 RepID=A0A839HC97_9GAMM|nr:phosphoenolpyruvate--protein phosphotransferase [Thiospirillum jenense]MBB1126595.1 phosphoenolpyruvate--protein phosphotransferase [Thiospirillum jenense]
MLESLRRIVQEVNRALSLEDALKVIVTRVKEAVSADVCSVYLTDTDRREHILFATDGLRPEAVGQVRIPLNRGLVGWVAEKADLVSLSDASQHSRYLFVTETGENRYRGFLGVPIIQNRRVLGVLVLRQRDARCFADDEVTFVVTLAAQLANAIELGRMHQQDSLPNRFLSGMAASPGIGFGTVVVVYPPANLDAVPNKPITDPEAEAAVFRAALADVAAAITRIGDRFSQESDRALFDAWRLMLESDTLVDGALAHIYAGNWAQAALRDTILEHTAVFDQMDDPYLRERAADVRDLGRWILSRLQNQAALVVDYPPSTVLVGEEINVMQLSEVPRESLCGIVSTGGSTSSHIAILARGMGIPAAMGVNELPVSRLNGLDIIVDGYRGRVYIEPTASVRDEYTRLASEEQEFTAGLDTLRGLPSQSTDGYHLPLYLNTGLVSEQRPAGSDEAAGVGLYRTELPFLVRDRFPGESAQRSNYRLILQTFAPRPVTIRTLDIGGDKPLPYFPVEESNPFLGWRGIRIVLDHPQIFMTQIRAMLTAAVGLNNLHILLPMITNVSELDDALRLIHRAYDELTDEGQVVQLPPIGAMIEVPAAVYQAEAIAKRVNFLSVGTNDLTQYLLAVDRNNPHVARLYDDLHPAVLKALIATVDGARVHGRPVSVCGEMAGDPLGAVLLLGIGVDSLSMSAASLLRVKGVIRSLSRARARELLSDALACDTGAAVRQLLRAALDDLGLGALIRPGR